MTYTSLLFDISDHVANVTLNRPDAANAIDATAARELHEALLHSERDASVRVVVLSATGSMFCGGGNVKTFAEHGEGVTSYVKETTLWLHDAISIMARMASPVICAVNGVAAGGGLGLVAACDLAIAASSARFTMAYTAIGLTPDAGTSYNVTRLVGLRRALELTLTNRVLSAEEALAWGLVNQVVPDSQLEEASRLMAQQLSSGATGALGQAKRLLRRAWTETLETQMADERECIVAATRTSEAAEGIAAFVEKRPPRFLAGA
jgi:2-(1,2-epoxy-1,2-dihydrophenyl)acetyl-CoA isomerase